MAHEEALTLALEALKPRAGMPEPEYESLVNCAITAIKEALAQPEQEKERCVGCEACIDTACGRDECPKGWPKAAQPEQEPVAIDAKMDDVLRKAIVRSGKVITPPQRTWVGLTEDERTAIRAGVATYHDMTGWEYAKAVQQATELKLQEKNT